MSAVDDFVEAAGDTAKSVTSRADKFETAVVSVLVGWIVKNVFLDPAAVAFGGLEWVASSLFSSLDSSLRGSLSTAGGSIYAAFLGPEGWVTAIQAALIDLATSAGASSALAAGFANLLLLTIVVGGAYLLARAVTGYLSGGVLS